MTFGRKNLNSQRPRVDRFVAPRESFTDVRRRRSAGDEDTETKPADTWCVKHLLQKRYTSYLDEAFGVEPYASRASFEDYCVQTWPCVPRKRSYLSTSDNILDLPSYRYAPFPELLDWSSNNILVAALGRKYYNWSWRTHSLISTGITLFTIQCCKFDPTGTLLALGTDSTTVEVHNTSKSKYICGEKCWCVRLHDFRCSITAIDWSPTGNSFVTGCSGGTLVAFSSKCETIKFFVKDRNPILTVRVSPDARYVAVAVVNSIDVIVFTWPNLMPWSNLVGLASNSVIRCLAWHPWRSALLGIGAVTTELHTQIALWDTPPARVREATLGDSRHFLDAMLFSHRTGELVLSLCNAENTAATNNCSQLVVMSDPDTVVDQWGKGHSILDRVRTMVFSPDGSKLATATADEDLIIWNFLPEDKKKKTTNSKRFSAIPEYMDTVTLGFSLR